MDVKHHVHSQSLQDHAACVKLPPAIHGDVLYTWAIGDPSKAPAAVRPSKSTGKVQAGLEWKLTHSWSSLGSLKAHLQPGGPPLKELEKLTNTRFSVAWRPQKPSGLLGTGSPGRPPRLSHRSWSLERLFSFQCCFTFTETVRLIRDGEPRTATSTFTQLLGSEQYATFSSSNVALRPQRP